MGKAQSGPGASWTRSHLGVQERAVGRVALDVVCEQAVEELGRVAAGDGEHGATGDGGQARCRAQERGERHGGVDATAVNTLFFSQPCPRRALRCSMH